MGILTRVGFPKFVEIPDTPRGHILFFMPMCTKSAKITFMPVAERLVQLGHKVTLLTQYKSDVDFGGDFNDVIVKNDFLKRLMTDYSDNLWTDLTIGQKLKIANDWWTNKTVPSDIVSCTNNLGIKSFGPVTACIDN